jgi:ADP-ribosyl-[dinitrogen reductase] hydrolase
LNGYNKEEAIIGCLLGTAIGDALGLSCEGLSKRRLAKMYQNLEKYHFFLGKGMVSDDTEHSCMVAQSLIAAEGDVEKFKKIMAWKLRGWILGLPAGIGFATLRAILKLWLGFSPDKSGVFSAGNGPSMRSAIIGVYYGHDAEKLSAFTRASTRITHTDSKAFFGALAVALAAHLSSLKKLISPQEYLKKLEILLKNEPAEEFITLIKQVCDSVSQNHSTESFAESLKLQQGIGGYVYHTVPMVIHVWLKNQQNYHDALIDIIRCGGDTDTTAAILGGIIGAGVGKKGIPNHWITDLWEFPRTVAWIEKLGKRLFLTSNDGIKQRMLPISLTLIFIRNIVFMGIVLLHGFRRLLPPY